jgi:hypothetical protein
VHYKHIQDLMKKMKHSRNYSICKCSQRKKWFYYNWNPLLNVNECNFFFKENSILGIISRITNVLLSKCASLSRIICFIFGLGVKQHVLELSEKCLIYLFIRRNYSYLELWTLNSFPFLWLNLSHSKFVQLLHQVIQELNA